MSRPTKEDLHLVGLLLYKSNIWKLLEAQGVEIDLQQVDHDLDLFARAISDARGELERKVRSLKIAVERSDKMIESLEILNKNSVNFSSNNTEDIAKASVTALGLELASMRERISSLESHEHTAGYCEYCDR